MTFDPRKGITYQGRRQAATGKKHLQQWLEDVVLPLRGMDWAQAGGLPMCESGNFVVSRDVLSGKLDYNIPGASAKKAAKMRQDTYSRVLMELSKLEPESGHFVERVQRVIYGPAPDRWVSQTRWQQFGEWDYCVDLNDFGFNIKDKKAGEGRSVVCLPGGSKEGKKAKKDK